MSSIFVVFYICCHTTCEVIASMTVLICITHHTPSKVPEVYITDLVHNEQFPHHLTVEEAQGRIEVCLAIIGSLSEPVAIHLYTTSPTNGLYQAATGICKQYKIETVYY